MYTKRKIADHAETHLDDGADELSTALDALAPRIGKSVLPTPSATYENSLWWGNDGTLNHCDGAAWTPFSGGGARPAPTVLVAASDAIETEGADYICTGADDQAEINSAIADLLLMGGIVQLTEGTYTISGSILMTSNIVLRGCGCATQIKWAAGAASGVHMILVTGEDKVTVEDIYFNGTQPGVGDYWIIALTSCNDWLIQRCIFTNSDIGLYMDACSHVVILKNRFYLNSYSIQAVDTTAICTKLYISMNWAQSGGQNVMDIKATHSYVGRNHVNNQVANKHDFNMWGCDHTVVRDNIATGRAATAAAQYLIYADTSQYLIMRGNNLNGGGYGVKLDDSSGIGNVISSNVLRNGNSGDIYGDKNINNNSIVGNVVTGSSYGLDIRDTLHALIAFNVIHGIGIYALALQRGFGTASEVDNSLVVGNRVASSGGTTYSGIYLDEDSDINLLVGNLVSGSGSGYGIELSAGLNNAHVQMNHLRGTTLGWVDHGIETIKGASTVNNNMIGPGPLYYFPLLKEHQRWEGFYPAISFTNAYSGIYINSQSTSVGDGLLFIILPSTLLIDTNKIVWTWRLLTTNTAGMTWYCEIRDHEYDRTDDVTDFPISAELPSDVIQTVLAQFVANGVTYTATESVSISLDSPPTGDYVTLMFRLRDGSATKIGTMAIIDLIVTDSLDVTLWTCRNLNVTPYLELTGTYTDYGYVPE